MRLKGLHISLPSLQSIQGRRDESRGSGTSTGYRAGKGRHHDTRTVSAALLAETGSKRPHCKCGDMGLVAGIQVKDLFRDRLISAGCGERGICTRLDAVRRAFGY